MREIKLKIELCRLRYCTRETLVAHTPIHIHTYSRKTLESLAKNAQQCALKSNNWQMEHRVGDLWCVACGMWHVAVENDNFVDAALSARGQQTD